MQRSVTPVSSWSPATRWISLVATFAWGIYQSFWNLASSNFNTDEPIYLQAGWQYVHGVFTANREHPPTAKYLIGLAQVLFGEGALSGRIMTSFIVVLGGLVLWIWLKAEIGWMGALVPTALWLLFPRGDSFAHPKLDRFAILEPYMVFFAILAMALAWRWHRGGSYWFLAFAGIAFGLSVSSKVSTAVLLPVFLALILAGRKLRTAVIGSLVFGGAAALAFVVVYLPVGLRSGLSYMIEVQHKRNGVGHLVDVAGQATSHPAWWANFWFAYDGMGLAAVLVLAVGAFFAFFARPKGLVAYLSGAFVLLTLFYLFIVKNSLPHYYYAWIWIPCVLGGIGIVHLLRWKGPRLLQLAARCLATAMLATSLCVALWLSVAIANEGPTGVALIENTLQAHGVQPGQVLVEGDLGVYRPYLGARATTDLATPVIAIALEPSPRIPISPEVLAYLQTHKGDYTVYSLTPVSLYVFRHPVAILGH